MHRVCGVKRHPRRFVAQPSRPRDSLAAYSGGLVPCPVSRNTTPCDDTRVQPHAARRRILHVLAGTGWGGAENIGVALHRLTSAHGHSSRLEAPHPPRATHGHAPSPLWAYRAPP